MNERRNFLKIITGVLGVGLEKALAFEDTDYIAAYVSGKLDNPDILTEDDIYNEIEEYKHRNISSEQKYLSFINTHTEEESNILFKENGRFLQSGLNEFNHISRDVRAHQISPMDPFLLDYLYAIVSLIDAGQPIHLISGFRTRSTNEMLRRRSKGVAKNSFHIKGRAIDIAIPGFSARKIARVARQTIYGGVGEYRSSHFTHIDTGPKRHWSS